MLIVDYVIHPSFCLVNSFVSCHLIGSEAGQFVPETLEEDAAQEGVRSILHPRTKDSHRKGKDLHKGIKAITLHITHSHTFSVLQTHKVLIYIQFTLKKNLAVLYHFIISLTMKRTYIRTFSFNCFYWTQYKNLIKRTFSLLKGTSMSIIPVHLTPVSVDIFSFHSFNIDALYSTGTSLSTLYFLSSTSIFLHSYLFPDFYIILFLHGTSPSFVLLPFHVT